MPYSSKPPADALTLARAILFDICTYNPQKLNAASPGTRAQALAKEIEEGRELFKSMYKESTAFDRAVAEIENPDWRVPQLEDAAPPDDPNDPSPEYSGQRTRPPLVALSSLAVGLLWFAGGFLFLPGPSVFSGSVPFWGCGVLPLVFGIALLIRGRLAARAAR